MKKTNHGTVKAVPAGYHTVTPYLVVDGANDLIEFIKDAFDGKLTFITKSEDQKVVHATVKIGDSTIMISDTMEGMGAEPAMLYLYVENVDSVFKKAIEAGATNLRKVENEFYGDRAGAVTDKWGNKWWIGTHVEDVDNAELDKRSKEARKEHKKKEMVEHEE